MISLLRSTIMRSLHLQPPAALHLAPRHCQTYCDQGMEEGEGTDYAIASAVTVVWEE